jgi:hypothetical protein
MVQIMFRWTDYYVLTGALRARESIILKFFKLFKSLYAIQRYAKEKI